MAEPTSPPAPTSLDLCQRVLARAEAAEQLGDAVARDDAAAAAALAATLEQASVAMARALAAFQQAPPADGGATNRQLGLHLARLKAADQRTRALLTAARAESLAAWLAEARQRRPEATTLAAEVLRAPWDAGRDLVVVGAEPRDALIEALRAAGQRRIFCLGVPSRSVDVGAGHVLRAFATLGELEAACEDLASPPPTRVRVVGSFGSETAAITARVQEAASRVARMVDSFAVYGRAFLTAGARNFVAIARHASVAALSGVMKGVPAVIVSAGPSLDRNIAQLTAWKGRAVIIAINRAVPALLQAGVGPDIALAIDPLNLSGHFAAVRPGDITALGLGAAVVPGLFDVPADRHFTMAASPDIEAWSYEFLKEDARLPFGGTVAHTALQLALRMGCAPITVIGQDFALDGTKFYADGAADGGRRAQVVEGGAAATLDLAQVSDRQALSAGMPALERALPRLGQVELIPVPGYHQTGDVMTTPTMQMQLVAYRQMAVAASARTRLVNATEGGAFIEGMEHLPLATMTAALGPPLPITAKLRAALEPRQRSLRCGRMAKGLRVLLERLSALAAQAETLLPAARGGTLETRVAARFVAQVNEMPALRTILRTWTMGTQRALHEAGAPDDETTALLSATIEALGVYGPAVQAALQALGRASSSDHDPAT
jgi:hypothetical protein